MSRFMGTTMATIGIVREAKIPAGGAAAAKASRSLS
jgi:hypothetical protein